MRIRLEDLTQRCSTVVDGNFEKKALADVFEENEVVGFYFSSYTCPPCRAMTPKLIQAYERLKENRQRLELIFVSGDHSQTNFLEYFSSMPWLTLPDYPASPSIISSFFNIWMMPTLVLVRSDGTIITRSGCALLLNKLHEFPWSTHRDSIFASRKAVLSLVAFVVFTLVLYFVLML
eukprot:m.91926 g.91926  ORF g.91926 m.91926 type:complete len:177 (-) comp14650_c0_seq4:204-734(-)